MPQARFEIFKGKKEDWRFRLKAKNSEIIAVGQGYSSRQACLKGIKSIKKNAVDAPVYDMGKEEMVETIDEIEPVEEDESVIIGVETEEKVETEEEYSGISISSMTSNDLFAIVALFLAIVIIVALFAAA